jgi:hydrogenase maturation protease
VVCLGNPLRGDDGVGWAVAARLVGDPDLDADVICCHQLTPELALEVSQAERVVLVDARRGGTPGTVETAAVEPDRRPSSFFHGLTPPALVALAASLSGRVPTVLAVSVAAASFEVGEGLSPVVEAALPVAVAAVVGTIGGGGGPIVPTGATPGSAMNGGGRPPGGSPWNSVTSAPGPSSGTTGPGC